MVTVNKKSSFKDILAIVIESGHSRFPVMDLANKEVIGILLAKDLLKYYSTQEPQSFHLTAITRPTIFTPQSKRLDILLREFRANRNHIAIVLDEYGHVAGLVTIEDVLEQIVGDIEDEYDIDEDREQITSLDDGSFIVKASTLIAEFNHYFHTTFRDDEFDTIGGIILQAFSHLPKRGEKVKIAGLYFKVLHSDNRHVYLLEVKPVKAKEPLSSAEK
jgi:magnesium and cobalt transporter